MSKPIILLVCLLSILSCKEETVKNNFRVPIATNGITYHDDLIWVTDLIGQSITAVDPQTGVMVEQFDFRDLNTGPDDLIFLEDGTIVWTAPIANRVGKISIDGEISVLTETNGNVNPITQNTTTGEIFIGYESENGIVSKVDPISGDITELVEGLPSMNAFSFANNGLLYAPLFSVEGLLSGEGGVIKINLETGEFEEWEVSFPNETNKQVFKNTTAVKIDDNDNVYVLESINPSVFKVNIETGEAIKFGSIPTFSADNIALDINGNVYVTTFIQNVIFVFDKEGSRRKITIQQ